LSLFGFALAGNHVHLPVNPGFGGLGSGGIGLLGCGLGVQFCAWFVAVTPLQFRVCPS
jgi:hypothetical protein